MNTFLLEVLTPEKPFYRGDCVSLVIPVGDGMMGIMAHHIPITAAIHDGVVFFTLPEGERKVCAVERGMVTFSENRCRVLCESAVAPDEIDEEMERRALAEAEAEYRAKKSKEEYAFYQMTLAKTFNRLRVKGKSEADPKETP